MAAQRLQTDEQETNILQCRTSRVCHYSQNKKRSNPLLKMPTLRYFTFYFAQPHIALRRKFTFAK